jgi:hypothetical protein
MRDVSAVVDPSEVVPAATVAMQGRLRSWRLNQFTFYLPRFMAGGETNPLGARAMYLGNTEYRIHGTNQPSTIGTFVSSGCIRLTNEDVEDLYSRVSVGTRVIVLPGANTAASQLLPRR